jgi:hypothetical protein
MERRNYVERLNFTGFYDSHEKARGYIFSFNGQEKVDEVASAENTMTDTFWEYDAMLGRRQS